MSTTATLNKNLCVTFGRSSASTARVPHFAYVLIITSLVPKNATVAGCQANATPTALIVLADETSTNGLP